MVRHLRTQTFALLTPFYFSRPGLIVSLPAILTGLGLITVLLGVKVIRNSWCLSPDGGGFAFPQDRECHYVADEHRSDFWEHFSLFGYSRGIINQEQYTVLVTVVIASAIVPTLIRSWSLGRVTETWKGGWQKSADEKDSMR